MFRYFSIFIAAVHIAAGVAAAADRQTEEDALIAVLRSDGPPQDKDKACRKLKLVGTSRCVPALAPLLADATLWESALYAIQTIEGDEAAAALRKAAAAAKGASRAGIISCIGSRRDREAVGLLADALADTDTVVAASAAAALGKIGGPEAIAALRAAAGRGDPQVRAAVADALLACAEMLRGEDPRASAGLCRAVYESDAPLHIRIAAYRGLILASPDEAPAMLDRALAGNDRAATLAALKAIGEIPGQNVTRLCASRLDSLPPALQHALIEVLAQRGDPVAAPAIAALVRSEDPKVATAAVSALGALNDVSAVPVLLELAASDHPEREAAVAALVRLRGPAAADALLAQLEKARGRQLVVLIDVLARRQQKSAARAILAVARRPDDRAAQGAAIAALGALGDESTLEGMVRLLLRAGEDQQRNSLESAIAQIVSRSGDRSKCAAALLARLDGADTPSRCALLRLCSPLGGEPVLAALRQGLVHADPAVQNAALRALADCPDPAALPDLLNIVEKSSDVTRRVLAMRGVLRLAETPAVGPDRAVAALRTCMAAARDEDKRLILATAGRIASPAALALIEPHIAGPAAKNEAIAAALQVASAIHTSHPREALAALRRIVAASPDAKTLAEATKLIRKLEAAQQK